MVFGEILCNSFPHKRFMSFTSFRDILLWKKMKYYFVIVITVLVVIISLLFLILYKIYRLHVKSTEELDLYEQQELLSTVSGSKESTDLSSFSEHKDFLNNDVVDCRSVDLLDGINGKQEVDVTQVQPDIKVCSYSSFYALVVIFTFNLSI